MKKINSRNVWIKPKQSVFVDKKSGQKLYYPVAHSRGVVGMNLIAERMAARSCLSQGDVIAVLYNLQDEVHRALSDGYSVKIDGLGSFFVTLDATGNGVEKAEMVGSGQVKKVRVRFREERGNE